MAHSSPPRTRSLLVALLALALPGVLLPATATSAPAASAPAARTGTYENPLEPRVPGDGTVDSCADPAVLRGQQRGDRYWYLYCTTDPLNDDDLDAEGDLRFHPLPMMRSKNLVDWTYVGDALPEPPDWAADGAGLWAPDVVWSRKTRRYYLTFVVTDTDDSLRGPEACASTGDSAIGVATSKSPTGPWTVSDEPVVPPRPDPEAECSFFWTFDPDVLGDAVGGTSVLYYGSYYGGVHATRIALHRDGITTTGAPTQVAIGNRYEGTNVVRRGKHYYLFASATNCCNGPLTAYGVYAGRSRSPMGPFVDREGHRLTAGRVGGTPVVLPSGNRWIGMGHNTVFQDAAGQWWTVYHAVDRFDPYFRTDPGFTKRPALLDRLTWRSGWPQVRGGKGASDSPQRRPAVTADDRSPAPAGGPPRLRPGRPLPAFSDDFADGLDPAWTWVREPDATTYGVERGALRWQTQAGDLAREVNTASVLTRPAPAGDHVVQTRVRLDLPPEGCCQNFVQAGLVLYDNDDRYLKLVHVSIWETRQTEWAKEVPPGREEYPRYGNGVVGPPGAVTGLRIVVDRRRGAADRFTAFTRSGDDRWVRGGTWTHELGRDARIGLVSMGGEGYTARFDSLSTFELRRR